MGPLVDSENQKKYELVDPLMEMHDAGNNWYWAIDNVTIQSQTSPIGDLNYDGDLNIFDLLTLAEILVGVISPDTVLNHVSDINQDGETSFSDLILFLIYIMNH